MIACGRQNKHEHAQTEILPGERTFPAHVPLGMGLSIFPGTSCCSLWGYKGKPTGSHHLGSTHILGWDVHQDGAVRWHAGPKARATANAIFGLGIYLGGAIASLGAYVDEQALWAFSQFFGAMSLVHRCPFMVVLAEE